MGSVSDPWPVSILMGIFTLYNPLFTHMYNKITYNQPKRLNCEVFVKFFYPFGNRNQPVSGHTFVV